MAKQRHDIGYQKRNRSNPSTPTESPNELAKSLVNRGLASREILHLNQGSPSK